MYVAADAKINTSFSNSSAAERTSNGYVITGYIDISDTMTRTEPKLKIVFGSNKKKTARISYFDADKNYLGGSPSGGDYEAGSKHKVEWANDYNCTLYLGIIDNSKQSFYSNIVYVRIEAITINNPCLDSDKSVFQSITDADAGTASYQWVSTGHAFVPADYEDRIIDLEEDVDTAKSDIVNLKNAVDELNNASAETVEIPSYWEEMVAEKTETVKALQTAGGKDCVCFAWASDTHIPDNSGSRTNDLGKVMAKMLDNCEIPFAMLSGDVNTRGSYSTEELLVTSHAQLPIHLAPLWGTDRLLMALGNHDGTWGTSDGYYRHQFPPERMWQIYFRGQALDFRRVFSNDGLYYYVDNIAQKTRFIVLNSHFGGEYAEDENGWAVNNRFSTSCYGQEQLDWLADVALDMPEGYGAIITAHVPPNITYTVDKEQFIGVVNAFCNKTTYSGSFAGVDGWTSNSVSVDFTGAKGEIIAMFTGHVHWDKIDTTTMACPLITIIAAGATVNDWAMEEGDEAPTRTAGTDTETSFDVVTINRATRTINCTRVGAGSDREISY